MFDKPVIPTLEEVIEKAKAIPVDEVDTQEKKDRLLGLLERKVAFDKRHAHPEIFGYYLYILNYGFKVFEKEPLINGGDYLEPEEKRKIKGSLADSIAKLAEIPENILEWGDRNFVYCMYVAISETHNDMFRLDNYHYYQNELPRFLTEVPEQLKKLTSILSKDSIDNLGKYMHGSAFWSYEDFHKSMVALPSAIQQAQENGYMPQFEKLLRFMGSRHAIPEPAALMVSGFGKLCKTLEKKGKLDYFDQVFDRLLNAEFSIRKTMQPDSYSIFTPNEFLKMLESYEQHNLGDRFFEVMDFSTGIWKGGYPRFSKIGVDHDIDICFEFIQRFPDLHKRYGEDIFNIFRQWYGVFENHLSLTQFSHAMESFYAQGLDKKVGFDNWLAFCAKSTDSIVASQNSDLVYDSFEAVKNGFSLEDYGKHIKHIAENGLFFKSKKFAEVIGRDIPDEQQARLFRYYKLLQDLPNLPVFTCDNHWLNNLEGYFGVNRPVLMRLLDELDAFEAGAHNHDDYNERIRKYNVFESYIAALPVLIAEDVDIVESFFLAQCLPEGTNYSTFTALAPLVNLRIPFESKVELLSKLKGKEVLLGYADLDADISEWIPQAEQAHAGFCSQISSLGLSRKAQDTISKAIIPSEVRNDISTLMQDSVSKIFPVSRIYSEVEVPGLQQNIDPITASRLLVTGLITRDKAKVEEASRYLLTEKLEAAREFIRRSHIPPEGFYAVIKEDLRLLGESVGGSLHAQGRQFNITKNLTDAIRSSYLTSSTSAPGKDELRELVWLVESLSGGQEAFNKITVKMQDCRVNDIYGGDKLLCCAMLSHDGGRHEFEALYYTLDPYIGLLHVVPGLNGNCYDPIGAAILGVTDSEYGRVLLVDSVEGGHTLQSIPKDRSYNPILAGIAGAAQDVEAEHVIINTKVGGDTPKDFIKYVGKHLGIEPETVELQLAGRDEQIVSRKRRYLEAFQDQENLKGPVNGYLVSTEKLRSSFSLHS